MPTIDLNHLPPDDQPTWDLIGEGKTLGVFQLESPLGRTYAKQLKPQSIEHLSGLIAILRPGTLNVYDEKGVNGAKRFCLRKNGEDEVPKFHPVVDSILAPTFGILIYQEQSIELAKQLGGFNLVEADILRRAIGRKKAEEMTKSKNLFLEKVKTYGVIGEEQGAIVFDWIEKSNRYQFNKCLWKMSKVNIWRKDGYREVYLHEVLPGDFIYAPGNNHLTEPPKYTQVIATYYNGSKNVCRVTLKNNYQVQCTVDHKLLSSEGIKPLHEILDMDLKIWTMKGFSSIDCVRPEGLKETIDIEVESDNHLFFADGIAVSNSHSVGYAITAYQTAFLKTHFTQKFFRSYLKFAKEGQNAREDISALIDDAKTFGIETLAPKLDSDQYTFHIDGDDIRFGLGDIKGVGEASITKLKEKILKIDLKNVRWLDFMITFSDSLSITVFTSLIKAGTLDFFRIPRNTMLYELSKWTALTVKEQEWIIGRKDTLGSLLEAFQQISQPKPLGGTHDERRRKTVNDLAKSLENPPYSITDTLSSRDQQEQEFLGTSISAHLTEEYSDENTIKCVDFKNINSENVLLLVQIKELKEYKIRKGKNAGQIMYFLVLEDSSGIVDNVAAFSDAVEKYGSELVEKNIVYLNVKKNHKTGKSTVEKVWQAQHNYG